MRRRATKCFELVHTDVMGSIVQVTYKHSYKYVVTFIDNYSRFAVAYPMQDKTCVCECFEKYLLSIRVYFGCETYVSRIRCNNGREYIGGSFKEICDRENILVDFVPPYTLQHNGAAERFNQTVEVKTRSMLIDAGVPFEFWDLALAAAVHVYNW